MDPVSTENEKTQELKEQIALIIGKMDGDIRFHDFRVVEGSTHTNIIFDVVVPYEYSMTDRQVKTYIDQEVKKLSKRYFTVIEVDKECVQ